MPTRSKTTRKLQPSYAPVRRVHRDVSCANCSQCAECGAVPHTPAHEVAAWIGAAATVMLVLVGAASLIVAAVRPP